MDERYENSRYRILGQKFHSDNVTAGTDAEEDTVSAYVLDKSTRRFLEVKDIDTYNTYTGEREHQVRISPISEKDAIGKARSGITLDIEDGRELEVVTRRLDAWKKQNLAVQMSKDEMKMPRLNAAGAEALSQFGTGEGFRMPVQAQKQSWAMR